MRRGSAQSLAGIGRGEPGCPRGVDVQLLLFVLELVEAVVTAALGEEFLVRALFAEASFVEDEDAVGVLNGAEAMRDDERGAAAEQAIERVADFAARSWCPRWRWLRRGSGSADCAPGRERS